jgi:hypothetical protein
MKRWLLLFLSLGLCGYGWRQIHDYTWTPAEAPRWNPLALKESGFGRTLARVLTEQANTSYHHGLLERKPPMSNNPLSQWLDAGNSALGFQGRLKYRPIEQYPLRPYEVKQALEQVEKNLRLAFELDPGNYTAYDVYFYFLTNEVTQTEFASLAGAQLKDEDDDETPDQGGNVQGGNNSGPTAAAKLPPAGLHVTQAPAQPEEALQPWAEQERQRRNIRAIEITDEAIRKFRPNTMDPERFLTAAVMWYNRFMLLAPDPTERQKSAGARRKFAEVGPLTLSKMTYYIDGAKTCQRDLEAKGLWQVIPERRAEFLRVLQLIDKCVFTLSGALQHNRAQMSEDRPGSSVWAGPLGKN